jgi:SAM-dependent methyltransferase
MDCENLDYPDESFDVIYGRAILHHLNLHKANRQLLRVLKKEGVAVFIEPLGMNPVINLYRYLTPHLRTVDEKPLDYSDIRVIGEGFSQVKHKEMTLTPLPAIILQYGLQFLGIRFTNLRPFYQLDEKLFRLLPYLKQLSWNVILALQK